MTKNKERISWKETLQLNIRGFKVLYYFSPQTILSIICHSAWTSLAPYAGVYLSALLIEELAGPRDIKRLQGLVLISLITAAVIALVTAVFTCWRSAVRSNEWFKTHLPYTKKLFDMDFSAIDDTKNQQLLDRINEYRNGGGFGLPKLFLNLEKAVSSICSFVGGMALTVTLFTSPVPQSAEGYAFLNHPLCIIVLIAVMLLVACSSPALITKAGSYFSKNAGNHALGNRLFGFWAFSLPDKDYGADARIYRQDILAKHSNSDKTGIFGSSGHFAKLAMGPMGGYKAAGAAVSMVFVSIAYAFVCLKAWAGAFGVGMVTQYVASITKVATGISTLLMVIGDLRNNNPLLRNELEFLDIPNAMYQGSLTVEKRRDRQYEIEFHNVSFQYPGSTNYALRHVNMKFRVGQRLAVVGMNGSGKTTFIKLLCRLYDPTEGYITLNGIDIRKYNYLEYLSVFSVVFQDFKLFPFELGENVAGSTQYDAERVCDCLIKAGFGDRLKELSKGLHTYLYTNFDPEGVNLSGGEEQKIALARTLYKDAPFIILDEPTAALDPIAEAEVYSKFNQIIQDKTAIYISHRLSSCRFCDEILVFDQGSVVQQGSHETLVTAEGSKYHELWYAQAQYYV